MIEKIQISDVEKNLPSGVPVNIRALDSNGNSIQSTIRDVGNSVGVFSIRKEFVPFEEYMVPSSLTGGLMLVQYASSEYPIGVAIIFSNTGGAILNDAPGIGFFKQNERSVSVYRKENNGPIYVKNNIDSNRVVYVRYIPII